MFRTTAAALALSALAFALPAQAADREKDTAVEPVHFGAGSRGALLPSLYVSLAGLNAFDAYTTSKGLSLGAAEANPMMRAVAARPAVLWAVKGGVTAGSIYLAERLWKRNNKVGAVAVMLASNGMMAAVAGRNSNVIRQQGR